jgi:hypothetical protein
MTIIKNWIFSASKKKKGIMLSLKKFSTILNIKLDDSNWLFIKDDTIQLFLLIFIFRVFGKEPINFFKGIIIFHVKN